MPRIDGDEVSYGYGSLTEWWRVLPIGFEQGFSISRRPAGSGDLLLKLAASGEAGKSGRALVWGDIHYGGLVVTDAEGKVVPATLENEGDHVVISVNDAHATYPLVIDPLVWIGQKVVASDGQASDFLGIDVLISGATAFVGAPAMAIRPGKVFVFTRSDGSWSQAQVLTAQHEPVTGAPPNWADFFGWGLALSGDTLLVGAYNSFGQSGVNPNIIGPIGAAFVFEKTDGTWTQIQQLNPNDGLPSDWFGGAVALSGDTAIIGSYGHSAHGAHGAAYVFVNQDGTWTQTQELAPDDLGANGDDFGLAMAFDDTTLLIGAPGPEASNQPLPRGAVYAFAKSEGNWTQTQKFAPNDSAAGDLFGRAFALSGDTVLIGAPGATIGGNAGQGAVYVFDASSGTWTQAQKLSADDGLAYDHFGFSLAIHGDTAFVGEYRGQNWESGSHPPPPQKGLVYEFTESGSTWSQTREFAAADGVPGGGFGWDVTFDGNDLLVGAPFVAPGGNINQGAAYFYGRSDLGLAVSAPAHANPDSDFVSQVIATNYASVASPAVAVTVAVPAAASFVLANATQGACNEASGVVSCAFGPLPGNAGMAAANITLTAKGKVGDTIESTASVANATPALTAGATTAIIDNQPPTASDGTLNTKQNTSASGTLEAADSDGDPLTFSIVDEPSHGGVTLDDAATGAYTYTPNQGYSGSDSFTFEANDGIADSNVATVSITVEAPNQPPTASDGTLTTDENTAASATLEATDTDGDPLNFVIVTPPSHGSVTLDDVSSGAYTYTPEQDYSGSDSFTFKANDGTADSNTATVSVTIKAVSPPPPPPSPPPSGDSGGGSGTPLGLGLLLALAGLCGWRRLRRHGLS